MIREKMKTLLALLLLSTGVFAQCNFNESYDKMSGNYVVQTHSNIIEGSMLSMVGSELYLSKVYSKTDTNYFLHVSKIMKYQAIDGGLAPRKIKKGSTLIALLDGDQRIELVALQDVAEAKESKKVGTLTNMMEYRHSFKILYHIPKNLLQALTQKQLQALRINMEDDLGNPTIQDIEIREKSKGDLSSQLTCLIPQFYSK